jgi:hypothetical protein
VFFFFFIFVITIFAICSCLNLTYSGVQSGNYTGPVSANLTVQFKRTYNSKLSMC